MARVSSDYTLAVIHPKITKQWDPTRNENLTPQSMNSFDEKTKIVFSARRKRTRPLKSPLCGGFEAMIIEG